MRQVALNKHLQDFSLAVGILCYFSMYSFRRQAAQEAKSEYSSEDAMALLGHRASNPDTLRHYDKHGFDRRDMTSFRLGGVQLEDASIRKFFSPSNRLVSTFSFQYNLPTQESPLTHTIVVCSLISPNCSGPRTHRPEYQADL